MKVLYCAREGGGGAQGLSPIWPDIKAELQHIVLLEEAARKDAEAGTPISLSVTNDSSRSKEDDKIYTEILSILDRLDRLFGDPNEKPDSPVVRRLSKNVTYADDTTDAQLWHFPLDAIRRWATDAIGTGPSTKEAYSAASRLLQMIGELQTELKASGKPLIPDNVVTDVGRLASLVGRKCPRDCDYCGKPFVDDNLEQCRCQICQTEQGRLAIVNSALTNWWRWNQPIPQRLLDETEWNDFREAFFDRFGAWMGYGAIQANPRPKIAKRFPINIMLGTVFGPGSANANPPNRPRILGEARFYSALSRTLRTS